MIKDAQISIIIPTFNVEKYLSECLDSILNQTFKNFEVICVDDGSTDKTLEILKEYKNLDKRIFILQQHHSGAAEARNNGLKLADGKYVQFLDSDDFFEPTMLEELYNHAEKNNADLTVCSSKKVNNNGEIIEWGNPNSTIYRDIAPIEKVFNWKDYPESIFYLFNVVTWNKLYLRNMLLENKLHFQNLSSCNDVFFGHAVQICAKRIFILDKDLIYYRAERPNNISEKRGKNAVNIIYALQELKSFLIEKNCYEDLKDCLYHITKTGFCWQISHCKKDEEYNVFIKTMEKLIPNARELYFIVYKKDYITPEFLEKIIGNKKVVLWGASIFIKNVLKCEKKKNKNILGIVDLNKALWGTSCGNYEIFSPDALNKLKPDGVILTVLSNNDIIYKNLKNTFEEKYPNIKLFPNIFEKKYCKNTDGLII